MSAPTGACERGSPVPSRRTGIRSCVLTPQPLNLDACACFWSPGLESCVLGTPAPAGAYAGRAEGKGPAGVETPHRHESTSAGITSRSARGHRQQDGKGRNRSEKHCHEGRNQRDERSRTSNTNRTEQKHHSVPNTPAGSWPQHHWVFATERSRCLGPTRRESDGGGTPALEFRNPPQECAAQVRSLEYGLFLPTCFHLEQ